MKKKQLVKKILKGTGKVSWIITRETAKLSWQILQELPAALNEASGNKISSDITDRKKEISKEKEIAKFKIDCFENSSANANKLHDLQKEEHELNKQLQRLDTSKNIRRKRRSH